MPSLLPSMVNLSPALGLVEKLSLSPCIRCRGGLARYAVECAFRQHGLGVLVDDFVMCFVDKSQRHGVVAQDLLHVRVATAKLRHDLLLTHAGVLAAHEDQQVVLGGTLDGQRGVKAQCLEYIGAAIVAQAHADVACGT